MREVPHVGQRSTSFRTPDQTWRSSSATRIGFSRSRLAADDERRALNRLHLGPCFVDGRGMSLTRKRLRILEARRSARRSERVLRPATRSDKTRGPRARAESPG